MGVATPLPADRSFPSAGLFALRFHSHLSLALPLPAPLHCDAPPSSEAEKACWAFARPRALALSCSRACCCPCTRRKSWCFSPRTLQRSSVSIAPALTYTSSRCPLPFPPLSGVERPQTTTRRDDTSLSLVRAYYSLPLFFVRNGKAGAFSASLVQRLDGRRRLSIVAHECDLCGATEQHCIIFNGTVYASTYISPQNSM